MIDSSFYIVKLKIVFVVYYVVHTFKHLKVSRSETVSVCYLFTSEPSSTDFDFKACIPNFIG